MKKISGIFLVLCVVLACAPARAAGPIKIGVIAPLTGEFDTFGNKVVLGARLAMEFFLQHDPSAPVELLIQDSVGRPEMAANAASKLVKDGVVGVVAGPFPSHNLYAARILEEHHIPLIPAIHQDGDAAQLAPENAVASEFHRLYCREGHSFQDAIPPVVLSAFDATLALLLSAKAVDYPPDPKRIARQLTSTQFNVASGGIIFSAADPDNTGATPMGISPPNVIMQPNQCLTCDCERDHCRHCDRCQ